MAVDAVGEDGHPGCAGGYDAKLRGCERACGPGGQGGNGGGHGEGEEVEREADAGFEDADYGLVLEGGEGAEEGDEGVGAVAGDDEGVVVEIGRNGQEVGVDGLGAGDGVGEVVNAGWAGRGGVGRDVG